MCFGILLILEKNNFAILFLLCKTSLMWKTYIFNFISNRLIHIRIYVRIYVCVCVFVCGEVYTHTHKHAYIKLILINIMYFI